MYNLFIKWDLYSILRTNVYATDKNKTKKIIPIASSSSIKMMAGCFSLAKAKASLTSLAPSPINICTSCGPANFKNVDLVWAAQARAKSVFPVPGAPYKSTPEKNYSTYVCILK